MTEYLEEGLILDGYEARIQPGRPTPMRLTGHGTACGCRDCQVRAILAVLTEPVGLPGAALPEYGTAEPGCCKDCLRGPLHLGGRCVYCHMLYQAVLFTDPVPAHRDRCECAACCKTRHWKAALLVLGGIIGTLFVLTVLGYILGGTS